MTTLSIGIEALRKRGEEVNIDMCGETTPTDWSTMDEVVGKPFFSRKVCASGASGPGTCARSKERRKHVRFSFNDGAEIAPSPDVEDREEKDVQVIANLILSECAPTYVRILQWWDAGLRRDTVGVDPYVAWREELSRPSAILRESGGQQITSLFEELAVPQQEEKSQPTSIFRESSGLLISSALEDFASSPRTGAAHLTLSQRHVRFQSEPDVVTFEVNPDKKVEAHPEPDFAKLVPQCFRGLSFDTPLVGIVEPGSLSKVSPDAGPEEPKAKTVRFRPADSIELQEEMLAQCPGTHPKTKKRKQVSFSEESIIESLPRLEVDGRQTLVAQAETEVPRTHTQSSVCRYAIVAPQLSLSWPQSDNRYPSFLLRQFDYIPLSANAMWCLLACKTLANIIGIMQSVNFYSEAEVLHAFDKPALQVSVCKRNQEFMALLLLWDLRLQCQAEVMRTGDIAVATKIRPTDGLTTWLNCHEEAINHIIEDCKLSVVHRLAAGEVGDNQQAKIITALFVAGTIVKAGGHSDCTPLMLASVNGSRVLFEAGALVNVQDDYR